MKEVVAFMAEQRSYLIAKYDEGERLKRKLNAETVAKSMRAETIEGRPMFLPVPLCPAMCPSPC